VRLLSVLSTMWMYWCEGGLLNLLNILLVRYCDKEFFGVLKGRYLSPNNTVVSVRLT